ncbi:UDP-glucosyltransferase 2-like [Vanessa cardui]|uniref:UDP-glucosyltransferase 2-like n=1 Tax=Vanessa cardui TaxID=171605 RepID=UPI001F13B4B0|nr:UDP-glucosyltransferase 2-like [Vanessa cardui]
MKLVLVFLSVVATACAYNILCIQTVPSKSHYHLMKGIVDPLLKAGHQITFISTYPEAKPVKNLKYIDVSHIQMLIRNIDMGDRTKQGMSVVREFARNISRAAIGSPAVKEALMKERFDAVVTEWFFSDADSGYAAVQQVPWILLSGMTMHPHIENLVDAVRSVPVLPAIKNDSPIPMNFWSRVMNTFAFIYTSTGTVLDYPLVKSDYESYFSPIAKARGVTLPSYEEALYNVSILFVNSHPSFAPAQSLPPNVVEIGGYHISEEIPPLPKDLQDLLDSSTQGVVYFSMGSVLKSSQLPEKTKQDLIKLFGELPYTVLWKFEEKLEGLPKNVHIRPWMPQSSILAHKNLKVFITHGGLLSTLESLRYGVPIIAIPVFGDQPSNAQRCVRGGHALMVDFTPEMGGPLKAALKEMLSNDRYYKQAKYLSRLFTDRPVTTTHLIQHYVRLAIETNGADHLRSKALLYSWYQLWMLDQLAFLLVVLYIIYSVFKKIIGLFKKGNQHKNQSVKSKKEKRH